MDATILRIIDGDTYDAEVRVWHDITVHERIRLHAWDTPEVRGQCDRERMLARQATEYARRWIAEHAVWMHSGESSLTCTEAASHWAWPWQVPGWRDRGSEDDRRDGAMSDQMPDEVWIEASFNNDPNWPGFEREVYVAEDGLIPGCVVRYIRADMYEQAEAEQRRTASRLAEVLMQYTAARAERDRLRAALERAERSEIALVETSRDSGLFVNFDYQGIDPADLGAHFTDAMQALTTRNAVSKAACAQLIAEQAQRAEQAEAERDRLRAERDEREAALCVDIQEMYVERGRLRADIKRALPRLHEAMRHVRVEQWPAVHNALDAMRDLEEALGHD